MSTISGVNRSKIGVKNLSSKTYIKYALWVSWTVLFAVLLNEKFQIIALVESAIYIPAILLVFLHIYNLKYCQCKTENCCTKKNR